MSIKKDVRIIGGIAKIVEIENGKIMRVIEDYKEYLQKKKEKKKESKLNGNIYSNEKCLKKIDVEKDTILKEQNDGQINGPTNKLHIDDIINVINSNSIYREPHWECRKFRTRFKDHPTWVGIDNKTIKIINKILEDPIENRKFPSISDYIIDCISKWTNLYLFIKGKNQFLYNSISASNHKSLKTMLNIVFQRFEIDYVDFKNLLLSQDDKELLKFKDNFLNHIKLSLSYQTSFIDQKLTLNNIISDNTVRTIIDHMELHGLLPKGYMEILKKTKYEIKNFIEYGNNIQNIKHLIEVILSPPIIFDNNLEFSLSNCIYEIVRQSNRFEIHSDYIYMCIKEWTHVYYSIHHLLPSNYGYMLEIENINSFYDNYVRPICNNYLNAVRKDASLIPNLNEWTRESHLDKWFRNNYQLFGFSNIRRLGIKGSPDYICQYKDVYINIELEYESGNFIIHKHDPDVVNIVICYRKNKNLSIPVIPMLELNKEI